MPRSLERPETRRDNWLFAACLGLSTLALFIPAAWGVRIGSALRETALAPVVWLQDRAAEGRTSRARFRAVSAQRDSMAELARILPDLRAENERLRRLLGLGERLGPGFIPAEALRQTMPTDGRTVLLDRGAVHGVQRFAPVIGPEGLLGVVRDADERTSVVMTWMHPEFRVSAVSESGTVAGIVAPTSVSDASHTGLEFRAITYRDTLPDGTLVMASGLGGVYPRGVPIGTVAGVEREQLGWERVYRLRPVAHPGAVSHVLILQGESPITVPAAFEAMLEAQRDSAKAAARPPAPVTPAQPPESTSALPPVAGPPISGRVRAPGSDTGAAPLPAPRPRRVDTAAVRPAAPAVVAPPAPAAQDSAP
jgi:rod shape-determining protein MreC